MKLRYVFLLTPVLSAAVLLAAQDQTVMVGGESMFASKNIIANAMNSKDHTTLVAAVKAAGLVDTLQGAGPFTVFAPTNAAFGKLPAGTVETLVKPESKAALAKVLTYHVVAGKLDAEALMEESAGRQGHSRIDDRQRRQAVGARQRPEEPDPQGRDRHDVRDLDLRRVSVERRDPRRRRTC